MLLDFGVVQYILFWNFYRLDLYIRRGLIYNRVVCPHRLPRGAVAEAGEVFDPAANPFHDWGAPAALAVDSR
jgi:hypothetical protein